MVTEVTIQRDCPSKQWTEVHSSKKSRRATSPQSRQNEEKEDALVLVPQRRIRKGHARKTCSHHLTQSLMVYQDKKMSERILSHILEILTLLTGETCSHHLTQSLMVYQDKKMSERILSHILEILTLLTGEKHLVKPEHVSNRTVAVRVAGEAARAGNGRIYVGNLPADVREKELEELFHRYGRIRSVELKNRGRCSSSPFAFIKFQDPRDAEDAVFGRNGYDFGSCRLRVEFPRPFRGSRCDGGGYGVLRGRNGPPSRRSDFRVLVSGLPPSGSWQDLKNHMRKAGDVCYADVHKDGMGIVEFIRKEDMEYALRKLDDTKFRSHEGETYYIRVCPERNASYSRSRSRSRGRDSTYQSRRSPSPSRPY
ncbi:serine/arginine-rich splicing factor 9-like [Discoglossus pictus]